MTSTDRWEIRQLIASGIANASDFPDLDDDHTAGDSGQNELEEDFDVEVRNGDPPFLAGQIARTISLTIAYLSYKGRKELREAATNQKESESPSAEWNDPMANCEGRKFASDLQNAAKADNTT
ncbi:hypothetical protein GQX73_g908 [Xylaria multiplex]|uniref:Uncharacterized protein n=1 Tax=Xylaria multiplex TaxID=323545 RepID=A0A7C8N3U8_9PEZI|nr:hypothetical protein GQX73_g908 [Xylaria multiplex]